MRKRRLQVGHYFAAIHFKPIQTRDDWFHIHLLIDCSENLARVISELWPHGITRPGKPGITPEGAANYVMGYAFNPDFDWPDWFRNKSSQRFTSSKGLWSLDPLVWKRSRKSRKSTKPRPSVRRERRSVDERIERCGKGASIRVRRDGIRGGEVDLVIAEFPDRQLLESVLRGALDFSPADIVNADLGKGGLQSQSQLGAV